MKVPLYRFRIVVILFTAGFLVVFARIVYFASLQTQNSITKRKDIIRGKIEDRRSFPLAISVGNSTIAISPSEIYDIEKTAEILSRLLPMESAEIIKKIYFNKNKKYFYLMRQVENIAADRVMDLKLPGVHRERKYSRQYPNLSLASNLLGFVGQNQYSALSGLERDYNDVLISASGNSLNGHSIQLSLDAFMQYHLEKELGAAFEYSGSRRAAGILMNIESGEILAMASIPNFDPNLYYKSTPFQRGNWNIRFNYEPGSTIKIFMAAILLNENALRLNERILCDGEIHFGNSVVRCNRKGRMVKHGYLTLSDIIRRSCNVGIIKAMKRIKKEKFYHYMTSLGFGRQTDLLPPNSGETSGYFPSRQNWVNSTSYYLPIGQGFSVTPVQLLRAGASIANGGRLLKPVIVKRIISEKGEIINEDLAYETKSPFDKMANQRVLKMMKAVVKSGTGRGAWLKDIAIAGKTGTGEKSSARGYLGKYVVSFMGFFPAPEPKYGMLILFDEPSGPHSGGSLAAPVFSKVVKSIWPYLDPSKSRIVQTGLQKLPVFMPKINVRQLPDFKGLSSRDSIQILSGYYDIAFELKGSGYVYAQRPAPGSPVADVRKVILYLDGL